MEKIEVTAKQTLEAPEWMPMLRKRIMWEVQLFIWSLPVSPARLAEARAEHELGLHKYQD